METAINVVPDVHQTPVLGGGFSDTFKKGGGGAAWKSSCVAVSAAVFMGNILSGPRGFAAKKRSLFLWPRLNKKPMKERYRLGDVRVTGFSEKRLEDGCLAPGREKKTDAAQTCSSATSNRLTLARCQATGTSGGSQTPRDEG